MTPQLLITGALPFALLIAALLAVPLALGLLRLYRRSVLAGMDERSGRGEPPPRRTAAMPPPPLSVAWLTPGSPCPPAGPALQHALRAPWRAAAVLAAGGAVYGAAMALAAMTGSGIAPRPMNTTIFALAYAWPALLALAMRLVDRRQRLALFGGYAAVYLGLWALAPRIDDSGSALVDGLVVWTSTNLLPTVLVAVVGWRRVRAVGPLVLAFLVLGVAGATALVQALQVHEPLLRAVSSVAFAAGLGGGATFWLLLGLGLAGAGLLAMPLLKALARRYEAGAFSEAQLSVDALWLVFAVAQGAVMAFNAPAWALSGLGAWLLARGVMALLWRRLPASPAPAQRLLLLRVFALGDRSQRFFERLRRHWLPLAPVSMIAGPDLVTSTVEPHEFMAFVGGRLSRQFVHDAADLERRVAAFDTRPAPDGLHRVEELFCRADTWQMAMQRLADDSAAVLMDLRGFGPGRDGCRYEIGRLLDTVPLSRVLLLVDGTTREDHLRATVDQLWAEAAADSPNRHAGVTLRVLSIDEPTQDTLHTMLAHLLAGPAAPAASAELQRPARRA